MSVHRKTKYQSFQESFGQHLVSSEPGQEKSITFFIEEGEDVISLNITAKRVGSGNIYHLTEITHQDESGNFHNFCSTKCGSSPSKLGIYDHDQDRILQDAFLEDKYDVCFDDWFSDILTYMFEQTPSLEHK